MLFSYNAIINKVHVLLVTVAACPLRALIIYYINSYLNLIINVGTSIP